MRWPEVACCEHCIKVDCGFQHINLIFYSSFFFFFFYFWFVFEFLFFSFLNVKWLNVKWLNVLFKCNSGILMRLLCCGEGCCHLEWSGQAVLIHHRQNSSSYSFTPSSTPPSPPSPPSPPPPPPPSPPKSPASRLKFQSWGPNPSLKAKILASSPKS